MSYFPPPYSPPPESFGDWYAAFAPREGLRPARQASLLMFVLGGLALFGAGMFYMLSVVPVDQLPPITRAQLEQTVSQSGMSIKTALRTCAVVVATPGIVMGLLGILVRGGRLAPVVLGIILDGLLLALVAIVVVGSIFGGGGNPLSACPFIVIGGLMCLLMVRLIAAAKYAAAARFGAAQQQMQYWQQYQGGEGEYGYGVGVGPVPGPPNDEGNE